MNRLAGNGFSYGAGNSPLLALQKLPEFGRLPPAVRHCEPTVPFVLVAGGFGFLLTLRNARHALVEQLKHLDIPQLLVTRAAYAETGNIRLSMRTALFQLPGLTAPTRSAWRAFELCGIQLG